MIVLEFVGSLGEGLVEFVEHLLLVVQSETRAKLEYALEKEEIGRREL